MIKLLVQNLTERLRCRKIAGERWGRSLQIRHLDCGSCNGCDFELAALLNPVYDIQRFGLDFVASPRHADVLAVTGVVTRNLEEAAHATYEAAPEPKLVVAVGDCACDGGVFRDGYAVVGPAEAVLSVDLKIPGCPPDPETILEALLELDLAAARRK
jgi:Ni,Fe-hydrogenase III small subunit